LLVCTLAGGLHGADIPIAGPAGKVDPFVGTDRSGNTNPGAQAPFGMVQMSPDNSEEGYRYPLQTMRGFTLNLMSGPGCPNGGSPLFTVTTGDVAVDSAHYSYSYDHHTESASPGYYRVLMQPFGINAELTASTRCGMGRFTFPAGKQANVVVPISFGNVPTYDGWVKLVDNRTLTGKTTQETFCGTHRRFSIYFAMKFSQPIGEHGAWLHGKIAAGADHAGQTAQSDDAGFYVSYPATASPITLTVRVGISYVDADGALKNLEAEMPEDKFDKYHARTLADWNKELGLIEIRGGTAGHQCVFYTALYHALLFPSVFDDSDGRCMGYDGVVRAVPRGHQHIYANFSGWDIYRSEFPLLTLIEPVRAQDMAQSIVAMYQQLGYIDRWPQANQPTGVMNGNPLSICLVNLWNAGLRNFDVPTAYEAMMKASVPASTNAHLGPYESLENRGGVWLNADSNTSTALEYDLSFAALGHLATSLNKPDDANFLFGRALEYRTLFNPETGYLQTRTAEGQWTDPDQGGYCEGNKWIYLWFVPEDVQGLVDLMGGSDAFEKKLDEFFDQKHYDPTNEPDLQAPYLYDYINRPWKTQKIVATTADEVFTDEPGGLAGGGNDDLGEMSAWYVFSQLGFYPVDPGIPYFEVCTPRFPEALVHLGGGAGAHTFRIDAPDAAAANIYIQNAALNGRNLTKPWFDEKEILGGTNWTVTVSARPNPDWAASPFDRPYSLSTGFDYLPPGVIAVPLVPATAGSSLKWRYTTERPAAHWMQPNFADANWAEAPGGFGTADEGVKPRTPWDTDDIWMRTEIDLPKVPARAGISVYHDQSVEVYVNGIRAGEDDQFVHAYTVMPLRGAARDSLRPGRNILAMHVHHPGPGRHFADAVVVELQPPEK
jgi:predicted alpha-1,2-mannosidase